jgi:hypothetical protein
MRSVIRISPFGKKAMLHGWASPWTTLATLNSSFSLENVCADATLTAMPLQIEAIINAIRKAAGFIMIILPNLERH